MTVPGYANDVQVPDKHEGEGEDEGEGGVDEGVQGNLSPGGGADQDTNTPCKAYQITEL